MAIVRALLDKLGRETLLRLVQTRSLPVDARRDGDRQLRSRLAYDYVADVDALLLDLRRSELLEISYRLAAATGKREERNGLRLRWPRELRDYVRRGLAEAPSHRSPRNVVVTLVKPSPGPTSKPPAPAKAPTKDVARSGALVGPAIVCRPGEVSVPKKVSRPPDYDLADLRLRFLTAVLDVHRENTPEWPAGYLEAAARGLSLRSGERDLLRARATGLRMGAHPPDIVVRELLPHLEWGEWSQLIDDLLRLNRHHPQAVQAIVDQVRSEGEPGLTRPEPRSNVADDLRAPVRALSTTPMAASPRHARSEAPTACNVRNLGALQGMFDDE